MNQTLKIFFLILFVASTSITVAQEFTVKVPKTDNYSGYLIPLKVGARYQFQVNVKNNTNKSYTVSIEKDHLGPAKSWVSIDSNKQNITSGQDKNFLLTLTIPSDALDMNYPLYLDFKAENSSNDITFNYYTQTIIVDKSKPTTPTYTVQASSTELAINSWHSSDARSSDYTIVNPESGILGISKYKIVAKNIETNKEYSVIKKSTEHNYYSFENLFSNTEYRISVSAYDLAGHISTSVKTIKTAPPKPTNLRFTQVTYINAKLSWNPSEGAAYYNVYKVNNSKGVKLNSSPITNKSFFIEGLDPNINYTFFVTAVNDAGSHSDRSDYASVTTASLPSILGSNVVCPGNATYSLSSLISGFTVSWTGSSNIQIASQSSTSVVINVQGNGNGYISANIISPQGQVLNLPNKEIWIGAPTISTFDFIDELDPYVLVKDHRPNFENLVILSAYDAAIHEASWYYPSRWNVYYTNNGIKNKTAGFVIPRSYRYNYGNISVRVRNDCGWSAYRNKRFDVIDGFGGFKSIQGISNNQDESADAFRVYPNIVTDVLSISLIGNNDGNNSEFIIFDTKGVVVHRSQIYQDKVELNVSGWAKGVYYIKLVSESEQTWKKLIIN